MKERKPIGIGRLDELLGGGLPEDSAVLVYGPPFLGKEALSRQFLLSGVQEGIPGILVLTNACAGDAREQLADADPAFAAYEKKGLVRYVDAYSKVVGADCNDPCTTYVDSGMDLHGISGAVNAAQAGLVKDHAAHRLVFDSVSTLVANTNPQTAFRFLQVFVGKARRAGATSLLLLDHGMHGDAEVQMIKHLVDGVLELKGENAKTLLRVEGVGTTENRGWVEYRLHPHGVEITGSFAAGRIR